MMPPRPAHVPHNAERTALQKMSITRGLTAERLLPTGSPHGGFCAMIRTIQHGSRQPTETTMGNDEKRSGEDRRAKKERRSGADTRSAAEKQLTGERRSGLDRRPGQDRRDKADSRK